MLEEGKDKKIVLKCQNIRLEKEKEGTKQNGRVRGKRMRNNTTDEAKEGGRRKKQRKKSQTMRNTSF